MSNQETIVLTGDRPTGRLHLGHFVGSIGNRIKLQDQASKSFYMIADIQGLTDNANNPQKIRDNVLEVVLDNLACGVDPKKTTMFIQSEVPQIAELTVLFMNLVTLQQLSHNPTIKTEAKEKGFNLNSRLEENESEDSIEKGIPMGFLNYPISQAADILFCCANTVPVGIDQMPVIEQANDIVKKFNSIYNVNIFPKINGVVGDTPRLVGVDGNAKMSKSLNNAIYLSDSYEEIKDKVMSMYTDPNHIHVDDPGRVEGNVVFTYLDIFDENKEEIEKLKQDYKKGGLGDVVIKKRLIEVLENIISPIRNKRQELEKDKDAVMRILEDGTKQARIHAEKTMLQVREALKINYF